MGRPRARVRVALVPVAAAMHTGLSLCGMCVAGAGGAGCPSFTVFMGLWLCCTARDVVITSLHANHHSVVTLRGVMPFLVKEHGGEYYAVALSPRMLERACLDGEGVCVHGTRGLCVWVDP